MLRLLITTTAVSPLAFTAVLALALPATAQDAEVGQEYEITIATEEDNQYTGPYGQVMIGSIFVMVPDAKVDERYTVRITAIAMNQYSGNRQAACEFELIGGDREGMCLPAP
jgi:predicted RNA-binding protein with TRAM domain